MTSTADAVGDGSLRQAINDVCFGGTIGFAPALANQTIGLTSAELTFTGQSPWMAQARPVWRSAADPDHSATVCG